MHSSEPWSLDEQSQILAIRRADGSLVCGTFAGNRNDMARIVAAVNAFRGIPIHVVENWAGTDNRGSEPEEWLSSPVTENGEGYVLASPAGGVMRLTNEQRERMVACLNACRGIPTSKLEKCVEMFCATDTGEAAALRSERASRYPA